MTKVNFANKTGEDMIGSVMLLGDAGEYGKYQFVEAASDASGSYRPIVVEKEDDAFTIAEKVLEQTTEIPDYTKSVSYSTVVFALNLNSVSSSALGPIPVEFQGVSTIQVQDAENPGVRLLVGETADEYNFIDVPIIDMHVTSIGFKDVDISTQEGALNAIEQIKGAINKVSDVRGTHGALQNRLEHIINHLGNTRENMQSAESVIRDTDMADEMMKYTKNSILVQSAQSMLAQANMLPEGVLKLMQP